MHYYNEIDPYCCAWLKNLIAEGLIPEGHVDERDIREVQPRDLAGYWQCHFFAGIAGWSLALRLAGWPDDREVWTGSCPCQPFSAAGKRKGFADERHLWPEWFRLIRECSPATIFGEQVANATEWLRLVRSDLEAVEYAVGAMPIQAASAGAEHIRNRLWFVAHNECPRKGWGRLPRSGESGSAYQKRAPSKLAGSSAGGGVGYANEQGSQGWNLLPKCADQHVVGAASVVNAQSIGWPAVTKSSSAFEWAIGADGKARRVKPGICLLAHGVPARVAKLRAFGNSLVPQAAKEFILASM